MTILSAGLIHKSWGLIIATRVTTWSGTRRCWPMLAPGSQPPKKLLPNWMWNHHEPPTRSCSPRGLGSTPAKSTCKINQWIYTNFWSQMHGIQLLQSAYPSPAPRQKTHAINPWLVISPSVGYPVISQDLQNLVSCPQLVIISPTWICKCRCA